MANLAPPPTYSPPAIFNQQTQTSEFSPQWLDWFMRLGDFISGPVVSFDADLRIAPLRSLQGFWSGLSGGSTGSAGYADRTKLKTTTANSFTHIPITPNGTGTDVDTHGAGIYICSDDSTSDTHYAHFLCTNNTTDIGYVGLISCIIGTPSQETTTTFPVYIATRDSGGTNGLTAAFNHTGGVTVSHSTAGLGWIYGDPKNYYGIGAGYAWVNSDGRFSGFNWSGSVIQFYIDTSYCYITPTVSDRRLKKNINTLDTDSTSIIKQLRPVTFKWREETIFGGDKKLQVGFIAQEVRQVIREAVKVEDGELGPDGQEKTKALEWIPIVAHLTKALQESIARIEVLETKVAALEAPR